jgi:CubicO group peptidase (beta-lactamase class C family)
VTRSFGRTREALRDAVASRVFPGAVVEVGRAARVEGRICVGALTYDSDSAGTSETTVYDLASLTKVLSTATLTASLVERGVIALDDPVRHWSDAWRAEDRRAVTLRHLLLHASGLPAHRRYFESMQGGPAFEAAIGREPLEYSPGSRSVYSDPGFILLGRVLEHAAQAPLEEQFDGWRQAALGGETAIRFRPPDSWLSRIAPTEDDTWRGRLIHGEVHDENAAALGGAAGHAGLFATAAAVGSCARWWMARSTREPWATFLARGPVPGSSRALGWDTMLTASSCGTRMSAGAVGHTGFTGTSLWIDVAQDYYVVLLSNRVHPSRTGDAMSRVRPAVHDAVADDLTRG